jgi:hypothetical protein
MKGLENGQQGLRHKRQRALTCAADTPNTRGSASVITEPDISISTNVCSARLTTQSIRVAKTRVDTLAVLDATNATTTFTTTSSPSGPPASCPDYPVTWKPFQAQSSHGRSMFVSSRGCSQPAVRTYPSQLQPLAHSASVTDSLLRDSFADLSGSSFLYVTQRTYLRGAIPPFYSTGD